MTLRMRTLLVLGVTLTGLVAILYASMQSSLSDSFGKLEEQETRENIQRALDALSEDIARLNSTASDWAPWDDTYAFIEDANENYIKSNLTDDTFVNLRLNLMVFVNSSDQVVLGKAFDLEDRTEIPVPQSLLDYLADPRSQTVLLRHPDPQSSVAGILLLAGPEDPFLIASRPILKSGGAGPIRGALIMGRRLDDVEITQLARLTHLSLTVLRPDDMQSPQFDQSLIVVQQLSGQVIAGYALVRDIFGNPALVLRMDKPRNIYHQAQATLGSLMWALLIAGLVFIVMTMFLLDQLVLSRLARLNASIGGIGASGSLASRVEVMGRDELSNVASAINRMLEALQRSEAALRESEGRFRRLAENAPDAITRFEMIPQRHFAYVSPAIATLSGFTPEDYYADPDLGLRLVHPDDRPLLESIDQDKTSAGAPITLRWVRQDGTIVWVEQRSVPIHDEAGNLVAVEGIARDITGRKRAEEALRKSEEGFRRRAAELRALYETSLRLSAQLETSQLLRIIVEQAIELLGADAGGLYIYDAQQNLLVLSLAVSYFQELGLLRLEPGQSLVGQAFQERRSMFVDEYRAWPEQPDMPVTGRRGSLAVPLLGTDGVLGVLEIASEHRFDEYDVRLTELFAAQAAVALEKARLHAEVQQRARELAALNKAGQAMSSVLNLQTVLEAVIAETKSLLSAEGVSVLLQDPHAHELVFAAVDSPLAQTLIGKRIPSTSGIAGWVMQEKRSALVSDAYNDPRFYRQIDEATGLTTHSLVAAPLMSKGAMIGVLEAINKAGGAFGRNDVEMLEAMASSAAIATENARLYQMEKEQRELAETLREVGATLASTLNTDTVLDRLLEQVSRVVPNDVADIMLIEGDHARVARWRGYEQRGADASLANANLPIEDVPLLRQMDETGEPVVIPDTHVDLNWIIYPGVDWLRSYAGAPIRARDKVIGFLSVNSATLNLYGPEHAQRLRAFADQAAIALENARLFEEERRAADRLQALSRRLVEVQETERSRIARELHDEASQALTSMMVNLRLLEQEARRPEAVVARVAELKQMADSVLDGLHRLAADLRPASLDHLGLTAALRQYIQTFNRQSGLTVQFEAVGLGNERMPAEIETVLYRIVQEALTNVARHARASQVDVILERRGDQLVVIVEDNGVGFDPDAAWRSDRLGLIGIRERAEMLGGSLVVESEIGAGTTLLVEVPCPFAS